MARYATKLHEAFEKLHEATEFIVNQKRLTTLNINVSTFAMKWLIPRLLHFTAANSKYRSENDYLYPTGRFSFDRRRCSDFGLLRFPSTRGRKSHQSI